jgi:hypothetical protein
MQSPQLMVLGCAVQIRYCQKKKTSPAARNGPRLAQLWLIANALQDSRYSAAQVEKPRERRISRLQGLWHPLAPSQAADVALPAVSRRMRNPGPAATCAGSGVCTSHTASSSSSRMMGCQGAGRLAAAFGRSSQLRAALGGNRHVPLVTIQLHPSVFCHLPVRHCLASAQRMWALLGEGFHLALICHNLAAGRVLVHHESLQQLALHCSRS